jgi:hypothetical protein
MFHRHTSSWIPWPRVFLYSWSLTFGPAYASVMLLPLRLGAGIRKGSIRITCIRKGSIRIINIRIGSVMINHSLAFLCCSTFLIPLVDYGYIYDKHPPHWVCGVNVWFPYLSTAAKSQTRIWVLSFVLSVALVLVPAPLVEFRYYTIPFVILVLHSPAIGSG